jgi:hypothetical protein
MNRSTLRKKIAHREVIANKINVVSDKIAAKLDEQVERILLDAETVVKKHFPAKYVSASLTKLQKLLFKEGVQCTFSKKISREAILKTANSKITIAECDEAVKVICAAVVDEIEKSLELCEQGIKTIASKKDFAGSRIYTIHSMQTKVASKLNETGLNFKF